MISRVFGWSPPDNAEYLDVPLLEIQPLNGPKNNRKSSQISSSEAAMNVQSTSASNTSSFSAFESAQQRSCSGLDLPSAGDNNKRTDPTWVARPRNKFILFRCDYVRKHSCDGKRETEKSLSKQAAEAWHHLSKEDRLYWMECATGERIEHARRYPNYKYRPRKSSNKRRQACSSTNNSNSKSSTKAITHIVGNPHTQPRSPSNGNLPKHMLPMMKPTPSRPSCSAAVGDLSDKSLRLTSSLSTPGTSSLPSIRSPYNQQCNQTSTIPLPSCSQNSFNIPELNNFLTQTNPSTPASSVSTSLSDWNGGNIVHPFRSDPPSDISMSRLSQISNLDPVGLETAASVNNNNTGTNQAQLMHTKCSTEETQFAPPPSDPFHYLQQQQLFNNGLYQPTENFWISYPAVDGASMQMTQIAPQVDSFNAACTHSQHTIHDSACAATLASSPPSIPNNFYETMTLAVVGGTPNSGHEQLFAMGF